jgi:hypothetical protein
MCVPLVFFVAAWTYPLCVNFVPAYRDVADKFSTTDIGLVNTHADDGENQVGKGGLLGEADEEEDDNDDEMLAEEAVDEAELRVVEELDEEEELDDEEDETDAAVELRDDKVLEALEDDDVRVEDVVDCTLELAEIVEEVVVDLELDCDEETSLSHLPNPP